MIEFVGNNEVVLAQKRRYCPRIGRKPRLENHAGFDVLEARNLLLQLHVNLHRARNRAHSARSHAILAGSLKRRLAQLGMRREPKIIIRSEINHPLPVKRTKRSLLIIEHAQFEMRALGPEFVQLIGQKRQRINASRSRHRLPHGMARLAAKLSSVSGYHFSLPKYFTLASAIQTWAAPSRQS